LDIFIVAQFPGKIGGIGRISITLKALEATKR
jgi:hypothetical protein